MMISKDEPHPALMNLFLSSEEDDDPKSKFWLKMTDESLPTHYSERNYLINFWKDDENHKIKDDRIYKI